MTTSPVTTSWAAPLRRRVLGLIGLVVAGLTAAACAEPSSASTGTDTGVQSAPPSTQIDPSDQPTPDPVRPDSPAAATGSTLWTERSSEIDVVVVGDSLTVSATEEIRTALVQIGVRNVEVDAVEGRRMATDLDGKPSGVAAIDRLGATSATARPDIWVVALGTNDVGAEAQPDELNSAIDAVLAELGRSSPVVWIDVFIDAKAEASADFDAQIRQVAIDRGDMVVGDWYHPAQGDGVLVDDGVHLTSAGREAFAETIAATVARLVPAQNSGSAAGAAELGN